MVRLFIPVIAAMLFLTSSTTLRTLNFTSSKQMAGSSAVPGQTRFIEEIAVTATPLAEKPERSPVRTAGPSAPVEKINKAMPAVSVSAPQHNTPSVNFMAARPSEVESAGSVQLKYAVLMNTEVESLPARQLLEAVDEWYGVRYRTGGNTKSGVDCSGFTCAVYAAVYGITLPRISRDQYHLSRKISTTELQEGDLLFFNTNGRGVSHVAVYLGNNKFIHASVSRGVMVSDLFEPYYIQRFVGAGRIDNKELVSASN